MQDKTIIIITGLFYAVLLTAIQLTAWYLGFNHGITAFVTATISLLVGGSAGYTIAAKKS